MGFLDDMKANRLGQKALSTHSQASDLIRQGRLADANAKLVLAADQYREAYEAGCRRVNIMMGYAALMMRNGEFARARELMKEISTDKTMSEDTHFELRISYSICLWRLGLLDEAIKTALYAGKHAKNSSYYSAICSFLVDKARQTGEFDEAQAILDEAMDYDDEDAPTLDSCGELCQIRSDYAKRTGNDEEAARLRKEAIDFYERALKARPGQITTLYALSGYALEDGDRARAKELVEKAILRSGSRVCPVSREMLIERRNQIG